MARRKHDDGDVGRGLMWRQGHRDLQGTERGRVCSWEPVAAFWPEVWLFGLEREKKSSKNN